MSHPDFPKAYDQYGSSIGRSNSYQSVIPAGKLRVYRVPLDRGGYDPGGAYWGIGAPLYCVEGPGDKVSDLWGRLTEAEPADFIRYTRAYSRADAYQAIGLKFGGPHPLAKSV